jgi:hypothetical protein
MKSNRTFSLVSTAVLVSSLLGSMLAFAQAAQTYKAELRIVPLQSVAGRANIDESSSVFATANVTATLNGTKLTLNGSFDGFKNPASLAQLRTGPAMGARGPVIAELTVTKATKGTITGMVDLTAEQVNLLKGSRLYIQIHNTNTPDGALWGWLLK